MFMKKLLICTVLFAFGCTGTRQQADNKQNGNTSAAVSQSASSVKPGTEEENKVQAVYRASETILTDLVHTKLEVNFDWNNARMNGRETLTAKPHFYASSQLILDAKGMDISAVKMNGSACAYTYKDDVLIIELDKVYQRGQQYTVLIDYVAKPDERTTSGSKAITSDKGLYFINPRGEDPSKMPQIWTQGETEASSVWFPTIDAPNHKTTQEIFITVDDKYVTLSNGRLVSSKKNPDGTRTDHWKQDKPHAPYLFMMGIGEFKIVKDSYKRPDGSLMDVHYYVEPQWEKYARDIFGETPAMIGFFSKILGVEYPWDKYHQIVVRDYVSGAMENTGAVVLGDFLYKTDRDLLDSDDNSTIAHELFHHWFGDLVTCESWSNLPLNESFANYSQYLWDEYRYGLYEADYNANGEMQGYMQSAQSTGYHNLIRFDYKNHEDMFDAHSYNKGGRILHMLRNYVGDSAFFLAIHNYLVTNAYKPAEFHHLRLAFEDVTGEDLNWFFNQWFLGKGHPKLNVRYTTTPESVTVHIEQKQNLSKFPLFRLPVDVVVYDDKGATTHRIVITDRTQEFELPVNGKLNNVWFDSQAMLLAEITEKKEPSWYVHQYYNTDRWRSRHDALAMGIGSKTPEAMKMIVDALSDPFWDIRITAIQKSGMLDGGTYTAQAVEKMKSMVANDPSSAIRRNLCGVLPALLPAAEAQPFLEDRIRNDRSYGVLANALSQLSKIDEAKAIQLAKPLENEPSSKILSGIASLYAKSGSAEHYPFFERVLTDGSISGFEIFGTLNSFSIFLGNCEPSVIRKGIKVIEYQSENGGAYAAMFIPGCVNYLNRQLSGMVTRYGEEESKAKQSGNLNAADIARSKKTEAEELIQVLSAISKKSEEK